MKRGIEVWTDYDRTGMWTLHVKKKRGKLSLEEITEACMEYGQDFYMLVICAMDMEVGQYYDTDDLQGDYATLYLADQFFEWRAKS